MNATVERRAINVKRTWTRYSVMLLCIKNNLYSRGTNKEYENMLNMTESMAEGPTYENIYRMAKDIRDHSDGQTICSIMSMIENSVVHTEFEIDVR